MSDINDDEIFELQARAVASGDRKLLSLTYAALGYSMEYAFVEVSDWRRSRARAACAQELRPERLETVAAV